MLMKIRSVFILAGLVLEGIVAFQCSQSSVLSKYDIDKHFVDTTILKSTPPTKTKDTIWVRLCEEVQDKAPEWCGKDALLCFKQEVEFSKDESRVVQVVEVTKSYEEYMEVESSKDLAVRFPSVNWGDSLVTVHVKFACNADAAADNITFDLWNGLDLFLVLEGPSGCAKNARPSSSKPMSLIGKWITWFVIYAALFTLVYLVAMSYVNTRNGGIQDFREEFFDRSKALFSSLPDFAREVVGKVVGSSNVSRGGYSAV